ncbi:MAG: RNA 2',3'-cyclic phosphodiesterase [Candidatus Micrarchaeota archaeon]|nr:RNA 2',3'-cyclic phosphodiesterase [Candidatus Micrarchaeota archaeon]
MDRGMIRAFIAIELSADIRAKLSSVSGELSGRGVTCVAQDNIHITLLFLGDVREQTLEAIKERLGKIRAKSFDISIEGIGAFGHKGPEVVFACVGDGLAEIKAIYSDIAHSISDLGFAAEEREFTPHATIARVRSGSAAEKAREFATAHGKDRFGVFTCSSIALKSSAIGEGVPKYTTLYSLELAP